MSNYFAQDQGLKKERQQLIDQCIEIAKDFNGSAFSTSMSPFLDENEMALDGKIEITFKDREEICATMSINGIFSDYRTTGYNIKLKSWRFKPRDPGTAAAKLLDPLSQSYWGVRYLKKPEKVRELIEQSWDYEKFKKYIKEHKKAAIMEKLFYERKTAAEFVYRNLNDEDIIENLQQMKDREEQNGKDGRIYQTTAEALLKSFASSKKEFEEFIAEKGE